MTRCGAKLCLPALVLAAAVGCATSTPQPGTESEAAAALPATGSSAGDVIEYANHLRTLEETELVALHEALVLENREHPSSSSTLRLAVLLSFPGGPDYDLDRAINLLNQIARSRRGEDPVYSRFAELLAAILIERRSVVADREHLRDRVAASNERIESLQSELDRARMTLAEEQRRSRELQNQLDALIELEEQLNGQSTELGGQDDGGDDGE